LCPSRKSFSPIRHYPASPEWRRARSARAMRPSGRKRCFRGPFFGEIGIPSGLCDQVYTGGRGLVASE
ncbi:hypothetical protein FRC11_001923, partial [Ceratobasidium sp. 423]